MMGRFGLLGLRLTHSFSPFIHAELGDYEYHLYEKTADDLDGFMKCGNFDGLNVTIPYKEAVIPYCRTLSETAKTIGSVNTITRLPDGSFHGDNTDYFGFAYLLKQAGINVPRGKTIILGSGGSSLTVQAVLRGMGAREVVVISRNGADNYTNIHRHHDARMIINTTPVGMYPQNGASPLDDLRMFKDCRAVVDLIYNPARTELLLQAGERGMVCANGLSMLVAQAKKSAESFMESLIDDGSIETIIAKIRHKTSNIILIGMPGCGKSSIGLALAQKTGREFADTDEWVEKASGKSIPAIFAEDGEETFRKWESKAMETLGKNSGLIIATGGGIVMRRENKNALRQNGVVFYLERDSRELPVIGRPLSAQLGVDALAAVRIPLYEQWSDHKIPVRGIEQTATDIGDRFRPG